MSMGEDTSSNLYTVTEVLTEEVEIHNVDTVEEVYDKLRGEGDCGDEAERTLLMKMYLLAYIQGVQSSMCSTLMRGRPRMRWFPLSPRAWWLLP